jgi:hypothetical protein
MPNTEPLTQENAAATPVDANSITESMRLPRKAKAKSENAVLPAKPPASAMKRPADTKAEIVLKKLRSAKGTSIEQLMHATGWQAHSIRGFLSGTVKKKMRLAVTSDTGKDGVRRYRVEDVAKAG